jgi:HEAT repeat protein
MSPEPVQTLIELLSDRKGAIRESARKALVDLGESAVPALLEATASNSKQLRWEAAKALSDIAAPESVEVLVRLLTDKDAEIRWMAGVGLSRIGAASIVPTLFAILHDPDSDRLRESGHHVLNVIARDHAALRPDLKLVIEALVDRPMEVLLPRVEIALQHFRQL